MTTIKCPECGRKYSDELRSCPKCGAKTKYVVIYLLLDLLFWPFGIHRFYARKTCMGIFTCVLTCTYYGIAITAIWGIVDLIKGIRNFKKPNNIFTEQ